MANELAFETKTLSATLDVAGHLGSLKACKGTYERQDADLRRRRRGLDVNKHMERQKLAQIKEMRSRIKVLLVGTPLVIDPRILETEGGFAPLRSALGRQYLKLAKEDRKLWLNTLMFIVTPDLYTVMDKIKLISEDISLGQQRNLLVGGPSGLGKSTLLDWYTICLDRRVVAVRNVIPGVKADAPDSKNAPKAIYERLLLEFGTVYLRGLSQIALRQMLMGCVEQCDTTRVIVDEVENIVGAAMKTHFVDLCNALKGVTIICASCNPYNFVAGPDSNQALRGRFQDCVTLEPYRGARLKALLTLIDLLLPFPEPSNLGHDVVVRMIEERTRGVLRDIMPLIRTACRTAIDTDAENVSVSLLEATWARLQSGRPSGPSEKD